MLIGDEHAVNSFERVQTQYQSRPSSNNDTIAAAERQPAAVSPQPNNADPHVGGGYEDELDGHHDDDEQYDEEYDDGGEYDEEDVDESEGDLEEEEEEVSDVDDADLMQRLESKYGRLETTDAPTSDEDDVAAARRSSNHRFD